MLLGRPWVLSQPTTDAEMEGITDEIRGNPSYSGVKLPDVLTNFDS